MKISTQSFLRFLIAAFLSITGFNVHGQTTLLSATGDGGFETGTTFAANGWTAVLPGANRQWQVGATAGVQAGTRAAYVGAPANYNGSNSATVQHFYRDIAIPAGSTNVLLSFYLEMPVIDANNDVFYVFTTTPSNTPVLGTLPAVGYTQQYTNTATAYGTFAAIPSIDLSALAGTTVRLVFTFKSNAVTPFANPAVDNIGIVATVPGCTGTPAAGAATSSVSSACPTGTFTVNVTGGTATSPGITYQLQSSPAGMNTFTNLGTAQATSTFTVTNQASPTDYQVITTCSTSGQSATSSLVSVGSAFITCYCSPTYSNGCSGDNIATVTLNTLSDAALTCSPVVKDRTTLQPGTLAIPDLQQGSTNNLVLTFGSDGNQYNGVWVDFNQNGVFESTEFFTSNTNAGSNGTATVVIAVPVNALLGNTRLRIRGGDDAQPLSTQACGAAAATFGSAADYKINITAAVACTGTPPTAVASGPAGACLGQNFTITATNLVPNGTSGITYQLQSSAAGANIFTNVGAAQLTPSFTLTQTAATDYRIVVSCTPSGQSSTSNTVAITMNAQINCYCAATHTIGCNASGTPYGAINTVSFNTLSHSPGCSASPYYTSVPKTTATTTVYPGNTYTFTINSGYYDQAGVWIDWDGDGVFATTEYYALGASNSTATATNKSAMILVPAGAVAGDTRIRIRTEYYGNTLNNTKACGALSYGQTVDYIITVGTAIPCAGTPPATTVSASVATACAGTTFTLSATGIPNGTTGLTYQWQYRVGAGAFANLTGATTNPYTGATLQGGTTDYQLVLTCTNGGGTTTSTNIVTVMQSAATACYCMPVYTTGCTSQDDINTFTLIGDNSTSFNQTATGCSTNAYADYTALTPVDLTQSYTYNGTINSEFSSGEYARIWIDFDDDGLFAATESVGTVSSFGTTLVPYTITIPATAALGNHRMRVRLVYSTTANTIDPCSSYTFGETHDYIVHILVAQPCVAPTAQATNLNLNTPTTNTVNGSFTAATPAASAYIVLLTPGGTTPSIVPVNGTVYIAGATLGNATVVSAGTGTTFSSNGLTGGNSYTYTVYDYNNTACTGGPIYNTTGPLTATVTTPSVVTYTGTGVWSNAANWSSGTVPNSCAQLVEIAPSSSVTLDGAYTAGTVTTTSATSTVIVPASTSLGICGGVTNNGTFTVSGGAVTVGTNGLFNNVMNDISGATIAVSSGTLNINGSLNAQSGSIFSQTGGAIAVDGNAGGNIANSVASGTPIVNFASPNLTLSGGTFTIVDPHAATTLTSVLDYSAASGNVEASPAHTFIFGDGVSTDPGGNASGMRFRPRAITTGGRLNLGSVIANAGTGTNRTVFQGANIVGINGNLTVNNGAEYRLNSGLFLNGNLTVNAGGTFTTQANLVTFASYTGGTAGGATAAQTVINNGTIQNITGAVTANFNGISVQNIYGLTFNSDISYAGVLTNTAASSGLGTGPSIITMANGSKLIQISGATQSGQSAVNGWINGRFQKSAATGAITNVYPIGDATTYAPITISNATGGTVTTAGNITASTTGGEYLVANAGVPRINSARINQDKDVNRYWTIEEGGGVAFSAAGIKVTPTWAATDVDASATPANFIVGRYVPANNGWVYPTVSAPLATSISALNDNNSGANTIAGDYIVGEPAGKPDITVALQGDVITTGANTGTMRNDLQTYLANFGVALLPTADPYGLGSTYAAINNPAGPAGTVVDWVQVDVTAPATPNTSVQSRALLLKPNGHIVDVRGLTPAFDVRTGATSLVIRHRNSLAVLSNPLATLNDVLSYNFTTALSQASSVAGDPAQMVLTGGKWAMWSGDINQNLGIDGTDKGQVQNAANAGAFDVYDVNDLSLDGGLDGTDAGIINYSSGVAPYSTLLNY